MRGREGNPVQQGGILTLFIFWRYMSATAVCVHVKKCESLLICECIVV